VYSAVGQPIALETIRILVSLCTEGEKEVPEVLVRWEECEEVRSVQEVKLRAQEGIDKWIEVIQSEQKSGQLQWTHLPHELAAVSAPTVHSRLECYPIRQGSEFEGRATQGGSQGEIMADRVQNASN
jgi:hypothetical protein